MSFPTSTDLVELDAFVALVTFLSVYLEKRFPKKLVAPFVVTTTMAIWSCVYYWGGSWEPTLESFSHGLDDVQGKRLMFYTMAYMFGDLPVLLHYGDYPTHERVMYTLHHLTILLSFSTVLYYDKYVRFMIVMITAEFSNIFLNSRDLVATYPVAKLLVEAAFVVVFFGYRFGYLGPFAYGVVYQLVERKMWFDLFVLHACTLYGCFIHLYWAKLVVVNVLEAVGLRKTAEKGNKHH